MIRESGSALLMFACLVFGGALLFHLFYIDPETGLSISFPKALYGTFSLIFFENTMDFPKLWYLQILYFLLPILGLLVVADGVIRFGVALTNKKERGQKWQIAMASTYSGHTIICGMGKVGFRVALELMKFGREIVAIEGDSNCRFVEKAKALDIPVIIADARRSENLIKAGVKRADAIIPCTEDELSNLDIALDARELNPSIKVVMRMFDPDLAQRVEKGFGIHTAFSVSALAAPIFAAASMRVNIKTSFYVNDVLLNLSELVIESGSNFEGWSIGKLEGVIDLTVVSYFEEGKTHLHPDSSQRLNAGCKILVLALLEALNKLEEMNHRPPRS